MKNEYKTGRDEEMKELDEGSLEMVGGGSYYKSNSGGLGSADTPEFRAGQIVLLWSYTENKWVEFLVLRVSDTKDGGWIHKEWTYDLERYDKNEETLRGVYENCIKHRR